MRTVPLLRQNCAAGKGAYALDIERQNIFLVRHGKPELPHGGKIYYGATDFPLSEDGIKSANLLSAALRDIDFDAVFSSTMSRARRTAEIISNGTEIKEINELCEINLGEWEGRGFDEVREQWKEIYEKRGASFDSVAPPGGESFIELQKRTVPAFEKILSECDAKNILIVSHGGVMWTLMCHYFNFKLNDMFFYLTDYCGIHLLQRENKLLRLKKYNWSPNIT